MKNKYELVIFDLDGTLLDTSPGIFNSVRFAEQQMGFTPILDARLKEFVGPPPKSMYMKNLWELMKILQWKQQNVTDSMA